MPSSRYLFHGVFCCFHPHSSNSTCDNDRATAKIKPSQYSSVPDDEIPVIIYGDSSSKPHYFSEYSDPGGCSICLGELINWHGEPLTILPKCGHMFHKGCIDQWLPSRSLHCPVCRDWAVEIKRSETERNNNGSRSQSDEDYESTLLALNFAHSVTRYSVLM